MENFYRDKRVLVTGACGTVGRELIEMLLADFKVGELVALDNNETALFLQAEKYKHNPYASFFLADVRDRNKLSRKMSDVDIVFHTAALKHVILCEQSPFEAVQTNVIGVQNIITAAIENNVQRVIFTSSDKAVNPTSVMGTSKLMCERLITAANSNLRKGGTIFSSTRFGNVLGSRGSVINVFHEQISSGGPVTLTNPRMTRFIMSIGEAVRLVIQSAFFAKGGEVFITKMPVIRIQDLAEVMVDELAQHHGFSPSDIEIKIIGVKAGEKMYEELMNKEETRRALELDRYFVVLPAFRSLYRDIEYKYPDVLSDQVKNPYHSNVEEPLSKSELAQFLKQNNLLGRKEQSVRSRMHGARHHALCALRKPKRGSE